MILKSHLPPLSTRLLNKHLYNILNPMRLHVLVNYWNIFYAYLNDKYTHDKPFVHFDLYSIRIHAKQIIQFLRNYKDVYQDSNEHAFSSCPQTTLDTLSQSCTIIVESLLNDVQELLQMATQKWNHEMNIVTNNVSINKDEVNALSHLHNLYHLYHLSPRCTTDAILCSIHADMYRYLYEFNQDQTTHLIAKNLYQKSLMYVEQGIKNNSSASFLSFSDEDLYGVYLNYSIFCNVCNNIDEAVQVCKDAMNLYYKLNARQPLQHEIMSEIYSNYNKWSLHASSLQDKSVY